MSRHIIGPFVCVGQIGHRWVCRWRHQPVEKVAQVSLHLWVSVFLNQKRTRGMLHEQRQEPITRDPTCDVASELIEAGAAGPNGEPIVRRVGQLLEYLQRNGFQLGIFWNGRVEIDRCVQVRFIEVEVIHTTVVRQHVGQLVAAEAEGAQVAFFGGL